MKAEVWSLIFKYLFEVPIRKIDYAVTRMDEYVLVQRAMGE